MFNTERELLQEFATTLDGGMSQRDIAKLFVMQMKTLDWCKKCMDKKKTCADVIFTDKNTLGKRRHKGSSSTGTNTQQKYMCGLAFPWKVPHQLFSSVA